MPPAVAAELNVPTTRLPALNPAQIRGVHVRAPDDAAAAARLRTLLGPGEAEAIVLAEEICAPLVLIDDRAGAACAASRGLRTTGAVGILIHAKERGLVGEVRPLLAGLKQGIGFHLSEDVVRRALELAGELPRQ